MLAYSDWRKWVGVSTTAVGSSDNQTGTCLGAFADCITVYDPLVDTGSNTSKKTFFPKRKTVIFNPPATIVLWDDGSKTVVKCMEGDEFNPEVGLAMCLAKYVLGKSYKKWFRDGMKKGQWQDKKATKQVEDEKGCGSVEQTERRIEEKAKEYGDVHRAVREALKEEINKKMGEGGER